MSRPERELVRLQSDHLELELLPKLGGRWHRLRAFGHDLLRTPQDLDAYGAEPFFWGGFVMAPWCNRVAAGPQEVAGGLVDLPANFPDGTAIHGQVHDLAWDVAGPGALRVAAGGDGWPWRYEVTQRIDVDGPRLRLALALTNEDAQPMPAGLGIHPWFVRPLEMELHADRVFCSNTESPLSPEPVGAAHDLRALREMPRDLDATWTDLGHPEVARLRWPAPGVVASMRISPEARYLCAASPRSVPAVAVEPQTHAPDGLRRLANGEVGGLRLLQPGSTLQLTVELEFSRA